VTHDPNDCHEPAPHGENDPENLVILPIEDRLDLHAFQPAEVGDLLHDYLEAAGVKGFKEVLIIHGKGTGALRQRVHGILRKHSMVSSFRQADALRGGWGATVVVLRAGGKDCAPKGDVPS
jgi:dsDNA-specific endonuclease/ATPase MutS2